jgi:hypothetical protein
MVNKGFNGKWKLNLKDSDIPPITKSQTISIETDGDFIDMVEEIINDKGEFLKISFKGKLDGLEYPVEGTSFADTESYRLLSPNIIEGIAKKSGKICVKESAVLSDSGDTIRVKYLSFNEDGTTKTSIGVFERAG